MLKGLQKDEVIAQRILVLRGQKVLIDADLAKLYGVTTKRLNEQVKRNKERFPEDFMFRINRQEKREVVAICDHLKQLKYSAVLPLAFTEHGALMLASVLNSPLAVNTSIQIVRAFLRMRKLMSEHQLLWQKLNQLEQKYDKQFAVVFDAIRRLIDPPVKKKLPIGFRPS